MATLSQLVTGIVVQSNRFPSDMKDLDERTVAEVLAASENLYDLLTGVAELYDFAEAIAPKLPAANGVSGADEEESE